MQYPFGRIDYGELSLDEIFYNLIFLKLSDDEQVRVIDTAYRNLFGKPYDC